MDYDRSDSSGEWFWSLLPFSGASDELFPILFLELGLGFVWCLWSFCGGRSLSLSLSVFFCWTVEVMVVLLVHGVRMVELVSWSWYSGNWGLGFEMEYWGFWGFVFVVVWSGFFDVTGITVWRRCRVLSLLINIACYDLLMWGGRKGMHWWQSYGVMVFGRYLISFWLQIQLWFFKRMGLLRTQLLFFPFECLGVLQITSNLNPLLRLGSGMWVTDFLLYLSA